MPDNVTVTPAYEVVALAGESGMATLRRIFPAGEADPLNFVLFSTGGTHGTYSSVEAVVTSLGTDEPQRLTVLIVQPRVARMLYGHITIAADDVPYLLKLRASSRAVAGAI